MLSAALVTASAVTALGAGQVATAGTAAADTCHWYVLWENAGVYSSPSQASTVLKLKHRYDVVGPYCDSNIAGDGERWTLVRLGSGGNGYMRSVALGLADRTG